MQVHADMLPLNHKFMDPVNVSLKMELGGTEGQRLTVVCIRMADASERGNNVMVLDRKGHIMHATSGMAQILGYQVHAMFATTLL